MSDEDWLLCTKEGKRYEAKYFADARIHLSEPDAPIGHHRETGLRYEKRGQEWVQVRPEFHLPAVKKLRRGGA
ncbi:hypothetical protein NQ152_07430 [Microbacterium sp. zg.B48]|uniref:hypothetical protein n=1 Tax=Microbacterium sp. zg.B48 TaxID=2969408 RepID=UPI00214BF1A4|nr:hypothetical protein [Microbacterium sp. zg.B48]MCR2763340.1 hypothetical protein [Microbacterium sp. zg.B48]